MRIFFDTEFIEDGRTIDLISIGMVREDGKRLYMQSEEADLEKASPWVWKNVYPHLDGLKEGLRRIGGHWFTRQKIATAVREFAGDSPEFWAYYADYDWVTLCQLYGTMMDLPKGWPMYCRDLKQMADFYNRTFPPQSVGESHHALADALWAKRSYEWLIEVEPQRGSFLG